MGSNDIFRFMTVRPPSLASAKTDPSVVARTPPWSSDFVEAVANASDGAAKRKLAVAFSQKDGRYIGDVKASHSRFLAEAFSFRDFVESGSGRSDSRDGVGGGGRLDMNSVRARLTVIADGDGYDRLAEAETFAPLGVALWSTYVARTLLPKVDKEEVLRLRVLLQFMMTVKVLADAEEGYADRVFAIWRTQSFLMPRSENPGAGAVNLIGFGELRLLREELIRYEAGEIAHVENVMASEQRDRSHTNTTRTESRALDDAEETTIERRDLETTTRFELQEALETTTNLGVDVQAGADVTATYGLVTVNASTQMGLTYGQSESRSSAKQMARETVDNAVYEIRNRTRRERERKSFHEVVEVNEHGFVNREADASHIRGIYRWLEKIYTVRLVNYGWRQMVEVIVPEPARRYILAKNSPEAVELRQLLDQRPLELHERRPADHVIAKLRSRRLRTFDGITTNNYVQWASEYGALDVSPPPPEKRLITLMLQSGDAKDTTSSSRDPEADPTFSVPEGYFVSRFKHRRHVLVHEKDNEAYQLNLLINGRHYAYGDHPPPHLKSNDGIDDDIYVDRSQTGKDWTVMPEPATELTVTAVGDLTINYVVHVDFELTRTDEALIAWKRDVYKAISEAHQARMEVYRDELDRLQAAEAAASFGRNPALNREVEKDELKRAAVEMFQEGPLGSARLVTDEGELIENFDEIGRLGRYAQFFEQAFEWKNISYMFYPYFWAEKDAWADLQAQRSEDPLFERFLRAGAARVLLPVRPEYDELVLRYLNAPTRPDDPWAGKEPGLKDELYVAIENEFSNPRGDDEVVEDEWSVTIPTNLVVLQSGVSLAGSLGEGEI